MKLSEELDKEIQTGMNPTGGSIPIHLERLNDYIEISRGMTTVIAGEPTSAKTTLVQDAYILEPIEWYLKHKPEGIKLSVISFLMERHMVSYVSRWISRWLFQEQGVLIHPKRILGKKQGQKLTKAEYELIKPYYKKLDLWEENDLLVASQGSINPTGIKDFIEAFALRHGKIIHKDRTDKSYENILKKEEYIPDHPNHIVLIVADNASVLNGENNLQPKALVDSFNKTMAKARDMYKFSPVIVQHMNREISNISRQNAQDFAPKLSDLSETSQTSNSADVVMALINPFKHKLMMEKDKGIDHGYQIARFRDEKFRTYYRQLHLLKNNFDAENISFPIGIHPVYGIMRTLPRIDEKHPVRKEIYEEVTTGAYFMQDYGTLETEEPKRQRPWAGFDKR